VKKMQPGVVSVCKTASGCEQLLWRLGTTCLGLLVAALAPMSAKADSVQIGTLTVRSSCTGDVMCMGTAVVFNQTTNQDFVEILFDVGAASYGNTSPQQIFSGEAEDVEFQNAVDRYNDLAGGTVLSVQGDLGILTSPVLLIITADGMFTATTDHFETPQFDADFSGSLPITITGTPYIPVSPVVTPEPKPRDLMLIAFGFGLILLTRKAGVPALNHHGDGRPVSRS
jgi:hypothetical protein